MRETADTITILTEQHRELQGELEQVQSLPTGDPRRRSGLKGAAVALVCHSTAVRLLYGITRWRVPGGDRPARPGVMDLVRAEETMKDLEFTDDDSGEFDPLLRRLIIRVRRHIDQAETIVYPRLHQELPPDLREDLAYELRRIEADATAVREMVERWARRDVIDRVRVILAERYADRRAGIGEPAGLVDISADEREWSGI
ncbi:hemerythrin domain-containing protein [Streptomyces sp. NPDC052236]|uniref:hemerythrin domain-containing protein n=1 Tax=Streptomyces sp. NPDC052236 TaxID=3365686 RepID=UPI0037D2849A